MWRREELKTNAKLILRENYWKAVLVGVVLILATTSSGGATPSRTAASVSSSGGLITSGLFLNGRSLFLTVAALFASTVSLVIGILISVFVLNPLAVGCHRFFIECRRWRPDVIPCLTFAFRNGYPNVGIVMFLKTLFTMLWSFLFIVPGIIKAYEYWMIPYLLAEDPEMGYREAFERSKEMMYGHKLDTFMLECSFFGWYIVSVFTCGILGIFYVIPYANLTRAELYHTLKSINYRPY